MITKKWCTNCGVTKPLKDFSPCRSCRDGLQGACKPCRVIEVRRYYSDHREKILSRQKKAQKSLHRKAFSTAAEGKQIKCAYCSETRLRELQLDHVRGDAQRSKTGYEFWRQIVKHPSERIAQILCKRHNSMKWNLSHQEFVQEILKLTKVFAK